MAYGRGSGIGGSEAFVYVDSTDARAALNALEWAISPLSAGMWLSGQMSPFLVRRAQQRFANEGDDAVGRWLPLRESTEELRANSGFPRDHPINRRTGELEEYITSGGNDVALTAMGARLTMPGSAASGELHDKVATAQEGRGFGGSRAPSEPHTVPRPVLGLSGTDLEFALVSLNTWVHEMVTARKGGMGVSRDVTPA